MKIESLNIWLIKTGEPLEMFGERPLRIGFLSKLLVERGHNVTWFTSTFDHQHKRYLFKETKFIKSKFGVNMVFLHSPTPYYRNISFLRLKNHKEIGHEFAKVSRQLNKPDIILSAFPTIDLAYEAVKYGLEKNVPVIIDVRDLWPEVFINVLPKSLRWFGKILLSTYFNKTKYIFRNCTSIIGVSNKYLEYGLRYADRDKGEKDKVFPLGYKKINLPLNSYELYEEKFKNMGIDKNKIIVWFVGTFGKTYDLKTVIKAADALRNDDRFQFVLTGDGDMMIKWKQMAKHLSNVIFTGWVDKYELAYLGSISNIGLLAYSKNAPQDMPNKFFEYCAYGLAILSSLKGEVEKYIKKEKIGFTYEAGDHENLKYHLLKLAHRDYYKSISHRALKLFEKQFSADRIYKDMAEYLENFI